MQSGAGGPWPRLNERQDPSVVCQQNPLWCGPACVVMVLTTRGIQANVNQQAVVAITNAPTGSKALAQALNTLDPIGPRWIGGPVTLPGQSAPGLLRILCRTGSWIAMFWHPQASIGHFVVVDGFDNNTTLDIRDPWSPGTRYSMKVQDFVHYWCDEAVFWR